VVENPTYVGALQAWNAYGAEFIPVPFDEEGMITSELEKTLRSSPKFIYVLPNFQNPTGVTLSFERRLQLIELSEKYGFRLLKMIPTDNYALKASTSPASWCSTAKPGTGTLLFRQCDLSRDFLENTIAGYKTGMGHRSHRGHS
jgi:hypothetical protein